MEDYWQKNFDQMLRSSRYYTDAFTDVINKQRHGKIVNNSDLIRRFSGVIARKREHRLNTIRVNWTQSNENSPNSLMLAKWVNMKRLYAYYSMKAFQSAGNQDDYRDDGHDHFGFKSVRAGSSLGEKKVGTSDKYTYTAPKTFGHGVHLPSFPEINENENCSFITGRCFSFITKLMDTAKTLFKNGRLSSCAHILTFVTILLVCLITHTTAAEAGNVVELQTGMEGLISFPLQWQQDPIEMPPFYTIGFESSTTPFCIHGLSYREGFKSESQEQRFQMDESNNTMHSLTVSITIYDVSVEDEGSYILLLTVDGLLESERVTSVRDVKVYTPPGKALCFVVKSADVHEIHCHATRGSGISATLSCFQANNMLPSTGELLEYGTDMWAIFLLTNFFSSSVSCCSHDSGHPTTQASCHDAEFIINGGEPTKMPPTSTTTYAGETETEIDSYGFGIDTASGCQKLAGVCGYLKCTIITMYLFIVLYSITM